MLPVGGMNGLAPLILSFSPWERGRCCIRRAPFRRPFSQGEKDRMRGASPRDSSDGSPFCAPKASRQGAFAIGGLGKRGQ